MSNEEKIIAMLGQMQTDISGMKIDISDVKTDMSDMKADISELQTTVTKISLTQENTVLPSLKLLAEGHQTLLDTLSPRSKVEALEEDVSVLKMAVRALSSELAELKKAL